MTTLARLRIVYSNWNGGPGVSTLYFSGGIPTGGNWDAAILDNLYDEVATGIGGWAPHLAQSVRYGIEPEIALVNDANGEITGMHVYGGTPWTGVSSATGGAEARATMILARLKTDRWLGGRLLQGRIFIGPVSGGGMLSDGTWNTSTQDDIADGLYASYTGIGPRLAVWHRPSAKGASDGTYGDVVNVIVPAKPAVLRSRRD